MMNSSEIKRYDRQVLLPELGIEGQQKLKDASVLVVGAGGLGCPVLLYLSAAGVGHIGIIDHDAVDESNLQRQVLYNTNDIGKNKADVAVIKLRLLNPHINLESYSLKLTKDNAVSFIEKYNLVIDGSDNFPTRYLVNDTCAALGKTLVFGSLFKFEGQIAVFNHKGGPGYRDLYPEPPLAEDVPNCGESGVIGTLPGIVGTYMANETIKLIAGFGETLSGRLMTIDALGNDVKVFNLSAGMQKINTSDTAGSFTTISAADLSEWQDQQDFLLIDVREPYEYEEHNIGGINLPLYELADKLLDLPKDKKLAFYCTSGYRSKIAVQLAIAKSFKQIFLIKN